MRSSSRASSRRAAPTASMSWCRSRRRYTYADTRRFSAIIAGALARSYRGLVTTEWTKAKRRGVLIDSNQNGEGKTIASVYSVRPKAGAPVSTPLRWDEVTEDLDPADFTMDVVLDRVRKHGDLFAGVLTTKQSLSTALKALRSDGDRLGRALAGEHALQSLDAFRIERRAALLAQERNGALVRPRRLDRHASTSARRRRHRPRGSARRVRSPSR